MRTRAMVTAMLALVSALGAARSASADCPSRPAWPTQGFPRRTDEPARLFPDRVRALDEYLFTLDGPDEDQKGIRTDALVIVHQGAIFYERYARGYTKDTPHFSWSVAKSITNMLAGIATREGLLKIDDSVCRYLPATPSDKCAITVRNLLEFASGLDWNEQYEEGSRQDSSVLAMLYGEGHQNMAAFVLGHPLRDAPGTSYEYSTGETMVLAAVVDEAFTPHFGRDYPWTLLFDPLGITTTTIETDRTGHHLGGAYSYAVAEDWARLGFLLLNDGCWENTRILPDGWVKDATAVSQPFMQKRVQDGPQDEQGREFWLNRVIPGLRDPRPWPDAPEDTFSAIGHWGQYITVIPSKDLVIVRSGDDRDEKAFDMNEYLKRSIAIVEGL